MTARTPCLGKWLWAQCTPLDGGWDVGLYGGDQSHVGAVTLAEPDGTHQTLQRPGHKDGILSREWALYFAEKLGCSVCVRCGIHFNRFSKADLPAVFAACEQLKSDMERMMKP